MGLDFIPVTDWQAVADTLVTACPSAFYREHAVHILERVERLGQLGPPQEEFRRVYSFLHYNEPRDVRRIVRELLERASGRRARLHIRNNAWRYTVAAYDEWYGHARIMYLAAGLIEGTLRSRLNERLTTVFGPKWFADSEAVPSSVRESPLVMRRVERMKRVEQRLASVDIDRLDLFAARTLLLTLQRVAHPAPAISAGPTDEPGAAAALPAANATSTQAAEPALDAKEGPKDGAALLADLTLAQLKSFFITERLHNEPARLKDLLRDPVTNAPIPLSQIEREFERYRRARNHVAHYVLGAELSFAQALFNAATLASWLGVDLQHFYGSVDVRQSTELSRVLTNQLTDLAWRVKPDQHTCETDGCTNPGPYDWMLVERAPHDGTELTPALALRRACLHHRVTFRVEQHRHVGL